MGLKTTCSGGEGKEHLSHGFQLPPSRVCLVGMNASELVGCTHVCTGQVGTPCHQGRTTGGRNKLPNSCTDWSPCRTVTTAIVGARGGANSNGLGVQEVSYTPSGREAICA